VLLVWGGLICQQTATALSETKTNDGSPGAECARGIQIKHGDGEGKEGVRREERGKREREKCDVTM
jgi:hypothetical protein